MTPAQDRDQSYPFWGYDDLAVFAGLVLPALFVASALIQLGKWLAPALFAGKAMAELPFQGIFYLLLFLALNALLRVKYQKPFWESLAWRFPYRGAWLSIVVGPLLAILVSAAGVLLRAPVVQLPFDEMIRSRFSIVLLGVFVSTIGPVCEELAFRGFLMPLLVRSLGMWPGIVLAAVPFALLHGPQYSWSWQHILLVAVAGTVFGWVRHKSGSTAASAVIHAGYNLTFYIAFLIERSG